jgi:methyltransferase (TIGR00027 family)
MGNNNYKPSQTALAVTLIRASSFLEKDSKLKSGDNLANIFLIPIIRLLIHIPFIRSYMRSHFPDKTYDYIIERTKYIDMQFSSALERQCRQVVIFGAGFDSRAIRLTSLPAAVKVFEFDQQATQQNKLRILDKHHINHDHITYVPLDLNHPDLEKRILSAGLIAGQRSLFIMEGLLMYLNPSTVETIFSLIQKISAPDSEVIFDCMKEKDVGESDKILNKIGEIHQFFATESDIAKLLSKYQLQLAELTSPVDRNSFIVKAVKI